jgi:hypothetical protein
MIEPGGFATIGASVASGNLTWRKAKWGADQDRTESEICTPG